MLLLPPPPLLLLLMITVLPSGTQTVRQLLSIVLSIFFFGHEINAMEALGVSIVFVALGVQILNKYQAKYRKKPTPKASPEVRRDAEMPPRCRRDAAEMPWRYRSAPSRRTGGPASA